MARVLSQDLEGCLMSWKGNPWTPHNWLEDTKLLGELVWL